jgi:DNA polymerase-3 subunit delta
LPIEKVREIIREIEEGRPAPIYFLMGEEPYFIDQIAHFIEESLLPQAQRDFNQQVMYGRDVTVDDIVGAARRFPMMAERQVIIVKEAQDLSREIEQLKSYAGNPQLSTVLVICYKYKKLDKRKNLYKELSRSGVLFESKKLYDNQVPDWIRRMVSSKGRHISPKAAQMLTEFLGNDLGKIHNELHKLELILPERSEITPQVIEENIGISKDFNNFELQDAIGNRDLTRAFRIVQYFGENPKNHPIPLTIGTLFNFFTKLLKYHALDNKSNAARELGVSPYFIKDYQRAAHNYPIKRVSAILTHLRDIDLKSKGVGASGTSNADLLKELLIKIFG